MELWHPSVTICLRRSPLTVSVCAFIWADGIGQIVRSAVFCSTVKNTSCNIAEITTTNHFSILWVFFIEEPPAHKHLYSHNNFHVSNVSPFLAQTSWNWDIEIYTHTHTHTLIGLRQMAEYCGTNLSQMDMKNGKIPQKKISLINRYALTSV